MAHQKTESRVTNVWAIYFIGFATLVEAIAFTMYYSLSLRNLLSVRDSYVENRIPMPDYLHTAFNLHAFILLFSLARIVFAIIVIVGHVFRNRTLLYIFLVWTAIGIVFNITLAVIASRNQLMRPFLSFIITGLHLIYLGIGWTVLKADNYQKKLEDQASRPAGFIPQPAPLQSSVYVVNDKKYQAGFNNQGIQELSKGRGQPAPPVYAEYPDGGDIGDQLPEKFGGGKHY